MCQIPKPLLLILHQLYKVGLIIPIYRWQNWELEGLLWYVQSCEAHECRAKSPNLHFSVQSLAVSSMPPSLCQPGWERTTAGLGKYQPTEVGVKSEKEREIRDWRDVAYRGKGGRMTAGRFLPPVLVGSLEALPWQPARQEALRRRKRKTLMSCSIPSKRSCALWLVPQFLFIVCVLSCFSCVWLFATLWTAAGQAPLSVGFPRLEYWSGFPFPSPEDLLDSGIKLTSPASSASPGGFFTTHA